MRPTIVHNKEKRIKIEGKDNKEKRPEFTDRVLHAICNDNYKDQDLIEQMKANIVELGEEVTRARFGANGNQVARDCAMKQHALAGTINETRMERILNNQVVILHALHILLFPNSPRILHETPMEESKESTTPDPTSN